MPPGAREETHAFPICKCLVNDHQDPPRLLAPAPLSLGPIQQRGPAAETETATRRQPSVKRAI